MYINKEKKSFSQKTNEKGNLSKELLPNNWNLKMIIYEQLEKTKRRISDKV